MSGSSQFAVRRNPHLKRKTGRMHKGKSKNHKEIRRKMKNGNYKLEENRKQLVRDQLLLEQTLRAATEILCTVRSFCELRTANCELPLILRTAHCPLFLRTANCELPLILPTTCS